MVNYILCRARTDFDFLINVELILELILELIFYSMDNALAN